jgi:hypothetical protein
MFRGAELVFRSVSLVVVLAGEDPAQVGALQESTADSER